MKKLALVFTALLTFGIILNSRAQPDVGKPNVAPTPFGAVEILIAAGAALGGKKAWDYRRQQKEDQN